MACLPSGRRQGWPNLLAEKRPSTPSVNALPPLSSFPSVDSFPRKIRLATRYPRICRTGMGEIFSGNLVEGCHNPVYRFGLGQCTHRSKLSWTHEFNSWIKKNSISTIENFYRACHICLVIKIYYNLILFHWMPSTRNGEYVVQHILSNKVFLGFHLEMKHMDEGYNKSICGPESEDFEMTMS